MQLTLTDYLGNATRISSLEKKVFRKRPSDIKEMSLL